MTRFNAASKRAAATRYRRIAGQMLTDMIRARNAGDWESADRIQAAHDRTCDLFNWLERGDG